MRFDIQNVLDCQRDWDFDIYFWRENLDETWIGNIFYSGCEESIFFQLPNGPMNTIFYEYVDTDHSPALWTKDQINQLAKNNMFTSHL